MSPKKPEKKPKATVAKKNDENPTMDPVVAPRPVDKVEWSPYEMKLGIHTESEW